MAKDLAMLKALNADELFLLHLDVTAELKKRLVAKKIYSKSNCRDCIRLVLTRAHDLVGLSHR
jgi:hypothetical protein